MILTPRQMDGFLHFAEKLERIDQHNSLYFSALAARGKESDLSKVMKALISDPEKETVKVSMMKPVFPPGANVKRVKIQ